MNKDFYIDAPFKLICKLNVAFDKLYHTRNCTTYFIIIFMIYIYEK